MIASPAARHLAWSSRIGQPSSGVHTRARFASREAMTAFSTRVTAAAVVMLVTMFGPGLVPAHAQTPRAAFAVVPGPELDLGVFPADFNRDGRIDLIGGVDPFGAPIVDLMIAIGRGDGTFDPPRSLGFAGQPLAVADFNRDGRLDVVVRTSTHVILLPGRGDGTFSAPRTIQPLETFSSEPLAVVADFTGDGRLDIGLPAATPGGEPRFGLYPGNGDLTFGAPAEVVAPIGAVAAVAGDFDRDGRLDLAVAANCCEVHVLLNQAGGFTDDSYPIAADLSDIATADLDGDGALDLVVTQFTISGPPSPARLSVFLGRGDGTFAPDVEYEAGVDGEHDIAIGDFTRDGILDIATANQSSWHDDDFGTQNGDSVSVLAGDGAGGFGDPVTFPLASDNGSAYQNRVNLIVPVDVDRDGHLDLVTSPAVVFLNRVPVPNQPPTVFVGPDYTVTADDFIALRAVASDPDGHFLRYSWNSSHSRGPFMYVLGTLSPGVYTHTVTVDDGVGGVATDSVTITVLPSSIERFLYLLGPPTGAHLDPGSAFVVGWTWGELPFDRFDLSYSVDGGRTFAPVAGCQALAGTVDECVWTTPAIETGEAILQLVGTYGSDVWVAISGLFAIGEEGQPVPTWQHRDVGAVGATGDASYDGATGTFTIAGAGADIWGTADEFHYVWRPIAVGTRVDFTARVDAVENVNPWTKVGLMIRSHHGPGAAHASIFVTPTTVKGIAFQRRRSEGAATVHTSGPKVTAPVWLRLSLHPDNLVRAYVRYGDLPWTLVGKDRITLSFFASVAGLVVSSHVDRQVATATFDGVTFVQPRSFSNRDIGSVPLAGSVGQIDAGVRMEGSGADIWGTADAFHFHSTETFQDVRVAARVVDVENTNAWAKAGVMIRETTTPGSPHVMVIVSPGRGVAMQYRAVAGGTSANVAVVAGVAPKWVRLTRRGDRFVGEMSDDGAAWHTIGEIEIAMSEGTRTGLAVTSHNTRALATATFEEISVETPPWP
jgi:regulation of enolase protein 1 (concanavalin A-like superfamily)